MGSSAVFGFWVLAACMLGVWAASVQEIVDGDEELAPVLAEDTPGGDTGTTELAVKEMEKKTPDCDDTPVVEGAIDAVTTPEGINAELAAEETSGVGGSVKKLILNVMMN